MKLKSTLHINDFIIAQVEALAAYILSMVGGLCKTNPTFVLEKENIMMLMDIGNLLCRINECRPEQILDVFSNEAPNISEVDKNIKFYTLLSKGLPQYLEAIDNRIKIICRLKKVVA